jgi:hypothetical protein
VHEQYPQQIKIVYKQFPLGIHNFAVRAAQFAIAAQQQGKFWEFHDRLFKHSHQLNDQIVETIRSDLHLDPDKFKRDMTASFGYNVLFSGRMVLAICCKRWLGPQFNGLIRFDYLLD